MAQVPSIVQRREPVDEFARWLFTIARKWQERWLRDRVFEADPDPSRPKFFITAAFPYPNSPLHLGHGRTYTVADVYARYKRMRGFNVLFPMGFHYTGTPIITMAESLAQGDKELEDLFVNVYDVPKEDLPKLTEALALARYFHEEAKKAMIEMGYSIDWRREFTSIDPEFKTFVVWQFEKLKSKGLVVQGSHPVGWCPKHNMPVGMHDTKGDVEPEIGQFTVILFELPDGFYMPAATLRPETVFGVTNLWVNPDAVYVKALVDGKKWIVSREAAYKLSFQKDVKVLEEVRGSQLVGLRAKNPATGKSVPVLPARFVDPSMATGVVMSVPAHAPYDYVALRELVEKHKELIEKLRVDPEELKPIPLIRVEGYGEFPAAEVVERRGIGSQEQRELLDEATRELYSLEYHKGVMREDIVNLVYPAEPENVRKFIVAPVKMWIAGAKVSDAREATVKWLQALDAADFIYEIMNRPVYCRCGTEVVVKVLKDQWFINYGDEEWKALARALLASMKVIPEELRQEFENVIEWLKLRAAARTRGLGTELPWAKGWIIESLSDSTIYMAFYTVVHKIRKYRLGPSKLTPEFWDYVMLGQGDASELSKKLGIPRHVLEELRNEFEYWYPLDSRHSGRDLVPNHLTFFIFNHAAVFPRSKWPRQIVVNGFVKLEGKKMSKSLRNIVPLRRALRVYGPDTIRATLLASAELLQDADFTDELARSVLNRLKDFFEYVKEVSDVSEMLSESLDLADRWLLSRLQRRIASVTEAMESLKLRKATVELLFEMPKDLERYRAMKGTLKTPAARRYVKTWTLLLAPIAPHIAEEAWSTLGGQGYVSLAQWPRVEERFLDPEAELSLAYVDMVVEDAREIMRVLKRAPKRMVVAVVRPSEWRLLVKALDAARKGLQLRDYMGQILSEVEPEHRKTLAKKLRRIYELALQLPEDVAELVVKLEKFDEKSVLTAMKHVVASAVGVEDIEVLYVDEAENVVPKPKLEAAVPLRPAILME